MNYTREEIAGHIDHTLLKQGATSAEIFKLCDEGIKGKAASVCIPPSYVEEAAFYVNKQIAVCTVIGFPNGYSSTASKVFETAECVLNGADEIDMVINIGWLKDKRYTDIHDEIVKIKNACGESLLKVIIETCLLSEEEKIEMCSIVSSSGADYIKTSTGFAGGGATEQDIALFKKHCKGIKIKAAGGVKDIETAAKFLELGANRLGTSSLLAQL